MNADEISHRLELQKEPNEKIRDFLAGIRGISSEVPNKVFATTSLEINLHLPCKPNWAVIYLEESLKEEETENDPVCH